MEKKEEIKEEKKEEDKEEKIQQFTQGISIFNTILRCCFFKIGKN
jgi:hypothetical protein